MFPTSEKQIYLIRYQKLILAFKNLNLERYEKHHILPKCLGGDNNIDNIVKLSPKAHYLAHLMLVKAYPNNKKLKHALAMMIVNNPYQFRKFTSKMYDKCKQLRSEALKGVPRPEWVKQKLRTPKKNKENYCKPKSEEHKKNLSKSLKGKNKGKKHTDETKRKIALASKGNTTRRDKTIYVFYHSIYGEHQCNRAELCEKFPDQLLRSDRVIINGYKGWSSKILSS